MQGICKFDFYSQFLEDIIHQELRSLAKYSLNLIRFLITKLNLEVTAMYDKFLLYLKNRSLFLNALDFQLIKQYLLNSYSVIRNFKSLFNII